jgi:hypothetical protein
VFVQKGGRKMRRDLSCFGESSVQIADAASSSSSSTTARRGGGGGKGAAQNQVSCLYQARLSGRPCMISVTWSKGLAGMQGLSVTVDDTCGQCLCKADVKPWLFSKKKGSKSLTAGDGKIEIFWDLSGAKFGPGPEPLEGFYVTVVFDHEMVLLLGDMKKDAYRKTCAVRPALSTLFLARKEHIHGKKIYSAKAQFCGSGQCHDIVIECDSVGLKDPCLEIRIDKRPVMQVKRLAWKFRGNQTIMVDGLPVEVFWDVHSWLFSSTASNAVFMFQTCPAPEKSIPWMYSQIFRESQSQGLGFSLILYAWKIE